MEQSQAAQVKAAGLGLGFDAVGICDLRPIERAALDEWLRRGYAGTMTYLHRQARRRREPERIAPGCRRAVVALKNYYREAGTAGPAGVARYAWGEDYHRVVGDLLAQLADRLVALGAARELTRCFVDAGPVPERELAQRAGLGWMAKNTMLISPTLGSFTFIGTVFTDLALDVDLPFDTDRCGDCRLCLDACPTDAFAAERVLDARRCISYLTIEQRKPFDAAQGRMVGDWLFGCDVCQDVCPWNLKFAPQTADARLAPRPELVAPDLAALATPDPAAFAARYGDTAFERAGPNGLARNAVQVLANQKK